MLHLNLWISPQAHQDRLDFQATYWCSHARSLIFHLLFLEPCIKRQLSSDLSNPSQPLKQLGYLVYHLFLWDSNYLPFSRKTHLRTFEDLHRWLFFEGTLLQRMHKQQQHDLKMPKYTQSNLHASRYVCYLARFQRMILWRWI